MENGEEKKETEEENCKSEGGKFKNEGGKGMKMSIGTEVQYELRLAPSFGYGIIQVIKSSFFPTP